MEEALELRAEARKQTRTVTTVFSKLRSSTKSSNQKQDAEDKFTRAATIFLREEQFADAADSFTEASKCASSVYTAAALSGEAARAWAKANENERAVRMYADSIAKFAQKGPLRRAALLAIELGELYEKMELYDPARKTFSQASAWFNESGETSKAANAQLQAANCASWSGDYVAAIADFEVAAQRACGDIGQRHKMKGYFLQSGLCYLANSDLIGLERALKDKYVVWDRAFSASDQFKLLSALLQAVRQMDMRKFELALYSYDQKHRLEKWQVETCLLVKQRISNPSNPVDELLWYPDAS